MVNKKLKYKLASLANHCLSNEFLPNDDKYSFADSLFRIAKSVDEGEEDNEEEDPKFADLKRSLKSAVNRIPYARAKKPLKRLFRDLGITIHTTAMTGEDLMRMVIRMAKPGKR